MKYNYRNKAFIIRIVSIHIFIFLCKDTTAQQLFTPVGATPWMLGGTSVAHTDVWTANNNVGAVTDLTKIQGGLYTEQRFNEKKLRLSNFSLVLPNKYIHIAATINYAGYTAYNQQKLGLSASKKLSNSIAIGVQLNYVSTYIDGYGTAGNIALAVGLLIKPISSLRLGFTLFNPTQNTYGKYTTEKIPSFAKLGCAYDVSEKITLHSEADQTLNNQLSIKGGVLYKIHPIFHLAIGAANNPVYYTFGTSLLFKAVKIDLATSFHQFLGVTPHVSISLPVQP